MSSSGNDKFYGATMKPRPITRALDHSAGPPRIQPLYEPSLQRKSRRTYRCVSATALAATLAVLFSAFANASTPPDRTAQTDRTIADSVGKFIASHPANLGVAAGVIVNGRSYSFAGGKLAAGRPESPTAETLYPIASMTKTFTATLLAEAALDGKLTLQDDPRRYLEGAYPNLAFQGHPIRLFDLLDHRSGLPFFLPDKPEAEPGFQSDELPFLTRLATLRHGYSNAGFYRDLHHVVLHAIPGSEPPHYSNAGADLAALILERIYHMPYSALLQARVLDPLHMADTCLPATCQGHNHAPQGYDSAGRPLPDDTSPLGAAGALHSNVRDLLKYAAWQMNETEPAVSLSHMPRATVGQYGAALNWQTWTAHGRRLIWQSGNVPGFGSLCAMQMSTKTAVVVLLNGSGDATTDAKEELANSIFRALDGNAVMLP